MVERFFQSVQAECTVHYQFANAQQAEQVVRDDSLMFYNSNRLYYCPGYQSLVQYEKQYLDMTAQKEYPLLPEHYNETIWNLPAFPVPSTLMLDAAPCDITDDAEFTARAPAALLKERTNND